MKYRKVIRQQIVTADGQTIARATSVAITEGTTAQDAETDQLSGQVKVSTTYRHSQSHSYSRASSQAKSH